MIISEHPQGSPWWQAERLGKLTASEFDKVLTASRLSLSSQLDGYLDRLVAEWMVGQPIETWRGSFWTERGSNFEASARTAFQITTGLSVQTVGFATSSDARLHGLVGASVDGLVMDGETPVGWLELKCPAPHTHIHYWRTRHDATPYRLQRNGQAYVTGLARGFFMSYYPGGPEVLVEYEPEQSVLDALAEHLPVAVERLLAMRQALTEAGVEPRDPMDWASEQESDAWVGAAE